MAENKEAHNQTKRNAETKHTRHYNRTELGKHKQKTKLYRVDTTAKPKIENEESHTSKKTKRQMQHFNTQKPTSEKKPRKSHRQSSLQYVQPTNQTQGTTHPTLSRFGPNLAARSVAHENSSKSNIVRDPSSSPPAPAPPASTVFAGRGREASIPPTLPAVTALKPSGGGWVNGDWPIFTSTASPSSKDRDGKKPGSS